MRLGGGGGRVWSLETKCEKFVVFNPSLKGIQWVSLAKTHIWRRWVLTPYMFVCNFYFFFVWQKYYLFNKIDLFIYKNYKRTKTYDRIKHTWVLNALFQIWPKMVNLSWIRQKNVNLRFKLNYFPNQASSVRFLYKVLPVQV